MMRTMSTTVMTPSLYAADYSPAPAPEILTRPEVGFCSARGAFVLVDKPLGLTSQAVVSRLRRVLGIRKIGHAGTLDPAASGMLIVGVGRATRLLTYIQGADKTYRARVRFGMETTSEDADGDVIARRGATLEQVVDTLPAALKKWTGEVRQRPSSVSAIKIDGERAYARVRAGEQVTLEERPVRIDRIDVVGAPRAEAAGGVGVVDVDVEVACSSGTYIRALARDLGNEIGCGAHLVALRRIAVGDLGVEDAWSLADVAACVSEEGPATAGCLRQTGAIVSHFLPTVALSDEEAAPLAHGGRVRASAAGVSASQRVRESGREHVALLDGRGEVRAVAERTGRWWQPRVVVSGEGTQGGTVA